MLLGVWVVWVVGLSVGLSPGVLLVRLGLRVGLGWVLLHDHNRLLLEVVFGVGRVRLLLIGPLLNLPATAPSNDAEHKDEYKNSAHDADPDDSGSTESSLL